MPFLAVSTPPSSSLTPRTFEKYRSCCLGAGDVESLMHDSQTSWFVCIEELAGDVFS